jgi:hypothetical protein
MRLRHQAMHNNGKDEDAAAIPTLSNAAVAATAAEKSGAVPNLPNVSEHQRRCAAAFMTSKAEWSAAAGPPSLHQGEQDGDQGRPNEQARCASSSNRHSQRLA